MNLVLAFIFQFVVSYGVIIEDAFTSNWVRYNHGQLVKYDLISPNELIAFTDESELLKFNMLDQLQMAWKLDLSDQTIANTNYLLGDDSIVTYGDNINVWNITTGSLIQTIHVKPIEIEVVSNGIIALDTSGDLVFYNSQKRLLKSGVSSFKSSEFNGIIYVLSSDSTLLKITDTIDQSTVNIKYNKISEFNQNRVIFDNNLFDLDDNKMILKSPDLHIIDSQFSYSFIKSKFTLYKDSQIVLTDDFEYSNVEVINGMIIVSSQSERKVIKLTSFFSTLEETSIDFEVYQFSNVDTKDYVFNDQLVSVGVYEKTIELINFNVDDEKLIKKTFNLINYKVTKSILINKPESKQTIESIQHLIDEINNNNFILRWYRRTTRHLSEFGRLVVSFIHSSKEKQEIPNPFGLEKLLVLINDEEITAIDSLDGQLVWSRRIEDGVYDLLDHDGNVLIVYKTKYLVIDSKSGEIIDAQSIKFDKVFKLNDQVVFKNGDSLITLGEPLSNSQIIEQSPNKVMSYRIENNVISKEWEFTRNDIISVQTKPQNSRTSSIGIPLGDKSVLYKYLNDTVAILSNEEHLKLYILDGTGNIIYSQVHEESIDLESIRIVMDDNWIIYSYFSLDPYEQRIMVIDLFQKDQIQVSVKSFIFPEKIIDMVPTYTRFGITVKSVIILTGDGDLIELPKFILNSRRIEDHVLTAEDFKADFRMMPYEPIIPRNNFQVLNHQYKLDVDQQNSILVKDTSLESTSIIALVNNKQVFISSLQPSLSFDKMKEFDKVMLGITIFVVIGVYFITNPMILKKKLNNRWVYQSV